ncbi:unnamed protein product, partial [Closterium sp. NIES-54]
DCKFMENLMYKDWKAENEAKICMRFGEVKGSGLEHVELPLELSSGSTTTRQSSLVNGGEEAKDAEEEEEEVQQVSERAPTLPSRTTSAPRIRVTPQQRQGLHVPAAEEEGRGKRRTKAPNRLTYEALGKPAKSALAGAALIVGDDEESDYDECAFVFFSPVEMLGEPATLKEALESSDAEEWKKAMESELKSIVENGTWELVELPEGRKAITSKWLFKIKSDADGNIERYKSRLVAKWYQQKEKVDYKELFASVVKPTTLRTLLVGAAIKGWVVKQMDVTTAFLNGVLEEEIFMVQPEGFDDCSGRVLKLKKALYGLKQAPRQWYLKLRGVLEEIGFTPSTADHLLFMLGEGEQRSFMVVYVDDILIFSPSSDLVKEVMLKLQDKFKCKALGDVSFYLGLHIERDVEKRCMRVHQRKYLEALAANFGQSEGHVATPFPFGFKCLKGPEEESFGEEDRRRFHSLVSSLMYAAVNTRPDVVFATGQLARVVQCPNEEQVAAGIRVAKAPDGVEPGRLFLAAFSGASFASEPEDMTSVGGFICCVGGGPTAWESKKQVDQALSSVESEYMALFRAVSTSGQVAASYSCHLLSHQTLLWHHRLGHPSLPRLRGMHSRLLVSSLPRSLPPLPPSPAPPCLPCVEGQQRAAPHSSSLPPTNAPLQTLHMDVWGPARVSGQGREHYSLLVVDDYTRYTTVFPLRSKGEVSAALIPWIRTVRLQLRERFGQDLPVLRLHSDRGGEFSSDLRGGEGITQSFTLPESPQQNGIAERRIGLVMEVARTSMIHAAAPHFLWPFAVRYAAHQLNLWPRVSLLETSPTLRWTGKVGDASVFRVWGSRAFVPDMSADKLSARAIPCVFLGFIPDAPGWQVYHPTSHHVLRSQDVTFDESVPFYRLFPYRSAPSPPPPLFLAPGPPPVDPLPPQGLAPSRVSQVDPLPCPAPVQVAVMSGAAPSAASGGAASTGAEPGGAGSEGAGSGGSEPEGVEPGGAKSKGAEPGGAESEGAESWGAKPRGAASSGGPTGASPRLSSQQLREWLVQRAHRRSAALGAGDPIEPGAAGAGGAGAGVARAVDPGAGGTVRPRPYFVPLLQQPASPLPVPSPYTEQSGRLTERCEPASRPVSPVRTAPHAPRPRPSPVPGTHTKALCPSSIALRVPLPAPPESSLPAVPDPESDRARDACPTVARLIATAVTDPCFESAAASALISELLDFASACRLDYASALVAESVPASPLSVGDPDAPDIPTPRSYVEAITSPYSSQWQAAMDAEMASWKSIGTYVDEVPPPGVNIVDGIWIFRVKQPPGSPPAFKARYVARGFSQRQGVEYFQTFSPTPKMTTLRVLLHAAAQRDYELHSLDFSTAFLQGSLLEEIWLRRPPGFTGSFPTDTQWSLRRPVYGLRQAPREWHDTLRTTLAALGFVPSTADPSLFLRTDTSLPPFYVLVHSLSSPPSDESVEPSGPYPELVGCLITSGMGLVLGGRGPVVLTGHADASWVDDSATQRSSQGYTFSLGTRSSSVLSSNFEAEIYAGAMAAQELRWLTYLLTDLGEQPRSPPDLYVDNKAMIALCQEHSLEHRTKHIALRYFLARELQQRGQLRLAYVATRANTTDVFTKALPPDDHQLFSTVLGLVPTLPQLLTA